MKTISVFIKILAVVLIIVWTYHVFAYEESPPQSMMNRAKGEPEIWLCESGKVTYYCIAFQEGEKLIVFIFDGKAVQAVFTTDKEWKKQDYIWFKDSI